MKKLFFLLTLLLAPVVSLAHPLGMQAFGHRVVLHADTNHVGVEYVVEIPTTALAEKILEYTGRNNIADFNEAESNKFNSHLLESLRNGLELYINGVRQILEADPAFTDETGKGDLNFFEYRLKLATRLPENSARYNIELSNNNIEERNAVYLDGIIAAAGIKLEKSNIPVKMDWSYDNSYRKISAEFSIDPAQATEEKIGGFVTRPPKQRDKLTSYLYEKNLTTPVIIGALLTALLLGAAHAFSPGHGKALVSAYLIGSGGKRRHAILLGIIVTLTHTAAVFLLGLVFIVLSKRVLPEQATPYIGMASGITIVIVGINVLVKRWHTFKHGHHHDHESEHGAPSFKSLLAMGISGGIVPCPSALALMLIAISINKAALGIVLVSAFSLGLASVLIVLGLFAISASSIFQKIDSEKRFLKIAPVVSAIAVIIIGIVISVAAFHAI